MIIWYILAAGFCLFLSTEYYAFRTGVPTIASFPSARRKIIEVLNKYSPKRLQAEPYTVIDLGSGNGQLACKIASRMPKARVIGIEISYIPWLFSCFRRKLLNLVNLEFKHTDFWSYDCSKADVVVIFLTENVIDRISQKLRRELKPGALVISNDTALRGDWQPIETVDIGLFKIKVYVYAQDKHSRGV